MSKHRAGPIGDCPADACRERVAEKATPRPWFKPPNPTVVIPENEMGLPAGEADVVELLREICHDPELVRFVADMMEE